MCDQCGCGDAGHDHDHTHEHTHEHGHDHTHTHTHVHSPEHTHSTDRPAARVIRVEQDILGKNNRFAAENRSFFRSYDIFAVNVLSSPGAGKTTLLVKTIADLKDRLTVGVVEGDQQTDLDAERIRAAGARAVQINTGRACHLDAHGVGHAARELKVAAGVLFVENVGNLVCPAEFDLGESKRVVLLSVTEGDDKPDKYPNIFATANLMIVTKIDLLPHVDFSVERAEASARRIRSDIEILRVSASTGAGMSEWYDWLERSRCS